MMRVGGRQRERSGEIGRDPVNQRRQGFTLIEVMVGMV